jgi:hypothetical protein
LRGEQHTEAQGRRHWGGISAPFVVISRRGRVRNFSYLKVVGVHVAVAVHVKVNDNVNDHGP